MATYIAILTATRAGTADDAEADDATQANIANPYMLSPNVCIEA